MATELLEHAHDARFAKIVKGHHAERLRLNIGLFSASDVVLQKDVSKCS